jgi:RHS repeat-associated protein
MSQANPVAGPVTFSYNADGKRVQKKTASQTRKFIYDFENVLQEADGGNFTTKEYTSTAEQYGELVSSYVAGQSLFYETDALGSTDALLTDSEFASDRYSYRAFGLATHTGSGAGGGAMLPSQLPFVLGSLGSASSSGTEYNWVGRLGYFQDTEIDLYYVRARSYDFATGRWVSEDPTGYADDLNLFRYARNNPTNAADPSGLEATCTCGKGEPGAASDLSSEQMNAPACSETMSGAEGQVAKDDKPAVFLKFPLPPDLKELFTRWFYTWHPDLRAVFNELPANEQEKVIARQATAARLKLYYDVNDEETTSYQQFEAFQTAANRQENAARAERQAKAEKAVRAMQERAQQERNHIPQLPAEKAPDRTPRCGKEVGDYLDTAFFELRNRFNALPDAQKLKVCKTMVGYRKWDIYEFYQLGGGSGDEARADIAGEFRTDTCGRGHCDGTITVHGECHWANEVNYFLWGRARYLCKSFYDRVRIQRFRAANEIESAWYVMLQVGNERVSVPEITLENTIEIAENYRNTRYILRRIGLDEDNPRYRRPGAGAGAKERVLWARVGWSGNYAEASSIKIDNTCQPCKVPYTGSLRFYLGEVDPAKNIEEKTLFGKKVYEFHLIDFRIYQPNSLLRAWVGPSR